jgi:hypothetical protein
MSDGENKTPAGELATRIINRLKQENLIRVTSNQDFEKKLASGRLSIDDWLLEVELTLEKE